MVLVIAIYSATMMAGFTLAGLIRSLWSLVTGESLRYNLNGPHDGLFVVRTIASLVAAPLQLWQSAVALFRRYPVRASLLALSSIFWSFAQGLVLLDQLFSLS